MLKSGSLATSTLASDTPIFFQNGILLTGGEDKKIKTSTGKVAYCIEDGHSARVKGIVVLSKSCGANDDEPYIVASASSDGIARV